jgi:hypothetical protein
LYHKLIGRIFGSDLRRFLHGLCKGLIHSHFLNLFLELRVRPVVVAKVNAKSLVKMY